VGYIPKPKNNPKLAPRLRQFLTDYFLYAGNEGVNFSLGKIDKVGLVAFLFGIALLFLIALHPSRWLSGYKPLTFSPFPIAIGIYQYHRI